MQWNIENKVITVKPLLIKQISILNIYSITDKAFEYQNRARDEKIVAERTLYFCLAHKLI